MEALCVLLAAVYQVVLVFCPHPAQIRNPALRMLVSLLGRISLLRHQDGPGTFHVPLTRQPWHVSEAGRRGEMQPLPPQRSEIKTVIPLGCLAALAFGSFLLLPGCRSFVDLAELASGYRRAALEKRERVTDDMERGLAALCQAAAIQCEVRAKAAQDALVNGSGDKAEKAALAYDAKTRMLDICEQAKVRPGDAPPPPPDMAKAPDLMQPRVLHDMATTAPAPAPTPDAGSRG